MAKTQRGKQAPKAGTAARASAARGARSTAKATRPVPAERKAARSAEAPARAPAVHATRATAAESRGKYVYCIIRSDDPLKFGPVGIGTEPADVHTVNYKELAAVVSDTPVEVFDATRENVLAHERVNETVMRNHTVIPMSFGTVFKTRDDIVELLRAAYEAFNDVLNKMQDKLEFGLKVLWDRDVMIREIEDEDEDVRRLKGEISSQKGSTYFARMQYGRLMDAALEARSERYVRDIFEELRPVSVASRANKPIGDKMIMNAAFLVAREKESAFDSKVKQIGARHGSLTFKYTGPWPPYNFVNIRLKLERAREGE
ncbi:MAG TPA: GvpL/GvpF family gas vesicle protein [Vicinamibacteria bacterium]|nr:GvpL/GvpF family gas vesicle protein [Vicinamibacteria bacterium]